MSRETLAMCLQMDTKFKTFLYSKPWMQIHVLNPRDLFFSSGNFETMQGILVPKLTLGPFLTLRVRNGSKKSKNPRRVEQIYTIYLLKRT